MKRFEAPDSDSGSSYYSDSDPSAKKRRRSSSSSDSADSGSNAIGDTKCQPAGLFLNQLAVMEDGTRSKEDSVYAQSGKDPSRIKAALKEPCCKAGCKKGLCFRLVLNMVTLFWALPKVSQDNLLWAMQQTTHPQMSDSEDESLSGQARHKISWKLEGLLLRLFSV